MKKILNLTNVHVLNHNLSNLVKGFKRVSDKADERVVELTIRFCIYSYCMQLHPGPRWGFDLTSLQVLANSHPAGAGQHFES